MKEGKNRIVFMGSPEFAVPILRALDQVFSVEGVVTQPDRHAGRGRHLTPPPVKLAALEMNLPVIQPERLRLPEAMGQLQAWYPDVIVVAAYGQILRQEVLDLPAHGSINVHASLLPRWRGAAPIQAAILHGDHETGITIMRMDAGVDTGPLLCSQSIPILPTDTAGSLSQRLAELGASLLMRALSDYLEGKLVPTPQPKVGITYAPMLKKAEGNLDFDQPAHALALKVRAFNPWPGAFFEYNAQPMKVLSAEAQPGRAVPGERLLYQGLPAIGCAEGILVLQEIQPAGKKPMSGKSFLQGGRVWK